MASTNKTQNLGLNQWLGSDRSKREDFNSDNVAIDAWAGEIKEEIEDIKSDISNDVVLNAEIDYGMNSVIKLINEASKFSVVPKFTIQGKTLINLLGKDGNCEDVSKLTVINATATLDSTNKIFGNNGIKITLTSTTASIGKQISALNLDNTKYYLISAYLKNGNTTTGIMLSANGANVNTSYITSSALFARVGIVVNPTNVSAITSIIAYATGASGQYAYVDGIMVNEITADEYALGATALLAKYPYVDSYTCLQSPYIEVKHDNLVRNGNGEEGVAWWNLGGTPSSFILDSNGYFVITDDDTTVNEGIYQNVYVKPNTIYTLSAVAKCGTSPDCRIAIKPLDDYGNEITASRVDISTTSVTDTTLTATTLIPNNCNRIGVLLGTGIGGTTGYADLGTAYFKQISLVEGTIAPTEYKSCSIERVVLETKLTSDDSITYENGEAIGLTNWKHPAPLYGKNYDWAYDQDFTGYKNILVPYTSGLLGIIPNIENSYGIKYDGKILKADHNKLSSDTFAHGTANYSISVSDSDTGWAETINPNNNEVKAFMNGWKVLGNDGARYTAWCNILDGTYPYNTSKTSGTTTTAQNKINVLDGSQFIVGRKFWVLNVNGGRDVYTISSISGNQLTLSYNVATSITDQTPILMCDDSSTDTRVLNYCRNNIAPNYEGYQLHYKLATPETITDDNCHIHGDIPKFDVGDNYLFLDSGEIIEELANPVSNGTLYYINDTALSGSILKNKTEYVNTIYKNNIFNNNKWLIYQAPGVNCYGNGKARSNDLASVDANATYTVDYKILATQAPQIGTIGCNYSQDISTAINNLQEDINNRQEHDSILDEIVDLSLYETYTSNDYATWGNINWIYDGTQLLIQIVIPFKVVKKVVPVITLNNIKIAYGTGGADITNKFNLYSIVAQTGLVRITYITSDSTIMSYIKNYGTTYRVDLIADCRGRI